MTERRVDRAQRAIMACGGDGIWDISLGAILVTIGLIELLAWEPLGALVVLLFYPFALAAKRLMTGPRLAEPEARQAPPGSVNAAIGILSLVVAVAVAVFLAILVLETRGLLPAWLAALLPTVLPIGLALLAVVIMVTAGTMINAAPRYFLYAAVLAAGLLALLWPGTPSWVPFLIPGATMIVMGLACLVRWLAAHPVLPPDRRVHYRF